MTQGEQSNLRALPAAYLHHQNKTNILNEVSSVYFLVTSLMGKQFTHFLSPNIQIIAQGFWLQRLLEAVVSFSLRFTRSNPWLILCPWHEELPRALSCPFWATQHRLGDESDSKIKWMCLCGHVHVRWGSSHELPTLKLPRFPSGHSESFFYGITRRKNLSHQQAKR